MADHALVYINMREAHCRWVKYAVFLPQLLVQLVSQGCWFQSH